MAQVFVGVGSNIDREINVPKALVMLRERYGPLVTSRCYESPAQGFDGDDFYNLVVSFESDDTPHQISDSLRDIEHRLHRVRGADRYVSRTMDLDVLLYDDWELDDDALILPSEDILQHEFVLGPLAEICGDLCHPTFGTPIAELWQHWRITHACVMRVVSVGEEATPAVDRQHLAGEVAGLSDQE